MTNGVDLMYNPKVFGKPGFGEVGIWLSYWPIGSSLDVGDTVNVSIVKMSRLEVCECGASLVYVDDEVVDENLMEWGEIFGEGFSGFQLSTGAYYLCRRDFFELMEVGRLTSEWFRTLLRDTIDYTEIRGWRKTGRPKLPNASFTELKTVKYIIHGPESNKQGDIYKIAEMSKSSSVDKTVEFTSTILGETMKSGTTSEIGDAATKIVLRVKLGNEAETQEVMNRVCELEGVESVVADTEEGELIVTGEVDLAKLIGRVRKIMQNAYIIYPKDNKQEFNSYNYYCHCKSWGFILLVCLNLKIYGGGHIRFIICIYSHMLLYEVHTDGFGFFGYRLGTNASVICACMFFLFVINGWIICTN